MVITEIIDRMKELNKEIEKMEKILFICLFLLGFLIGYLVNILIWDFYRIPKICEFLNATYLRTLDENLYCVKDNILIKVF